MSATRAGWSRAGARMTILAVPALVLATSAATASARPVSTTVPVGATIAVVSGSGQSATVGATFAQPLTAHVTVPSLLSAASDPAAGATVVFAVVPVGGASGAFGGATSVTAATAASGNATSPPITANGVAGAYQVTATLTAVAANNSGTEANPNPSTVSALHRAGSRQLRADNCPHPRPGALGHGAAPHRVVVRAAGGSRARAVRHRRHPAAGGAQVAAGERGDRLADADRRAAGAGGGEGGIEHNGGRSGLRQRKHPAVLAPDYRGYLLHHQLVGVHRGCRPPPRARAVGDLQHRLGQQRGVGLVGQVQLSRFAGDPQPLPRRFVDAHVHLGVAVEEAEDHVAGDVNATGTEPGARRDLHWQLPEGPQHRGNGVAADVVQRTPAVPGVQPVVTGRYAGKGKTRGDVPHRPDRAGREEALRALNPRMPAVPGRLAHQPARGTGRRRDRVYLGRRKPERLLAEHVLAGGQRCPGARQVGVVVQTDVDGLDGVVG